MTILQERLNLAGHELPSVPPGEAVAFDYARERDEYVLLTDVRGVQQGVVNGTHITVDGSAQALDLATKLDLEAKYRAGLPFTFTETYSDPTQTTAWTGCSFTAQPEFKELGGSQRGLYSFKFSLLAGVPA